MLEIYPLLVPYVLQSQIPASFDDSTTYYEAIAKLYAKINDLIEYTNTAIEIVNELATPEEIAAIRASIVNKADVSALTSLTNVVDTKATIVSLTQVATNLQTFINSVTADRKLSATGNFTGTLNSIQVIDVLSNVAEAFNQSTEIKNMLNSGTAIGRIYDGGLFTDGEFPVYIVDGGTF